MRPNFEEPLDTAKQLVEQNITLYMPPAYDIWIQFLLQSPVPEYNILGENMIIADDWGHFDNLTIESITEGKHAKPSFYLDSIELELAKHHPQGKGWYRSKEQLSGSNPYGGYLSNKKWHLNEVQSKIR